jgi:hypothetical protein
MTVLVVNNNRYLINQESLASESRIHEILNQYPVGTEFYFDSVRLEDVCRKAINTHN